MKPITIINSIILSLGISFISNSQNYTMPSEDSEHEGTWLQWPHQYEYGNAYRNSLDATWVAMTQALVGGEKVHIIAYNTTERTRIIGLLTSAGVNQTNVDFKIAQTNDVWVRDNGPIFVKDGSGNLKIEDWGFNGWGGDYNFNLCNPIPSTIASAISLPVINLNSTMTLEGGAVELDGNGVLMATRSSIISQSPPTSVRNPGMTQAQAETIMSTNLGVTKFIWLDGFTSSEDITDAHIDGFAKFSNSTTLLTLNNSDLLYWGLSVGDISTLFASTNVNNIPYTIVYVPLTQNDVSTTNGTNLGYKGSYCNYYIGNTAILVPNYNDPNDAVANAIIQGLHPGRTVIGIDVSNLYENGGMVHCVTQQQPIANASSGMIENQKNKIVIGHIFPNPVIETATMNISILDDANIQLIVFDNLGQKIVTKNYTKLLAGEHTLTLNTKSMEAGIYTVQLTINDLPIGNQTMFVSVD